MKKFMSVLLSVCMVIMSSVPVFAFNTSDVASKTAISDQEMAGAVGGAGGFDATITTWDRSIGFFQGTVANRWVGTGLTYSMDVVNCTTGAVVQTIIPTTSIGANTAKIISGTVNSAYRGSGSGYCGRVKLGSASYPGIQVADVESF
ncbi:MAG: hypothetical protein AABY87_01645 [bacterium]